ncbi:hypothetical protein DPMN_051616 [Dreissena polymorpha]|uniref:LRAT domain-containing protein n=1 Tax=Dreissena polymorpha TaxID=45954 RepID=A0A9D4CJP4_DREPO|nr:hypothetical protein DPMN_051616 [Dreissena polymorpha]
MAMKKSKDSEQMHEVRHLEDGDHIGEPGKGYTHHGIFLGHKEVVAHFSGDTAADAQLCTVDISGFTDNMRKRLFRINYGAGQCLSPKESVDIAKQYLQNPQSWNLIVI